MRERKPRRTIRSGALLLPPVSSNWTKLGKSSGFAFRQPLTEVAVQMHCYFSQTLPYTTTDHLTVFQVAHEKSIHNSSTHSTGIFANTTSLLTPLYQNPQHPNKRQKPIITCRLLLDRSLVAASSASFCSWYSIAAAAAAATPSSPYRLLARLMCHSAPRVAF